MCSTVVQSVFPPTVSSKLLHGGSSWPASAAASNSSPKLAAHAPAVKAHAYCRLRLRECVCGGAISLAMYLPRRGAWGALESAVRWWRRT